MKKIITILLALLLALSFAACDATSAGAAGSGEGGAAAAQTVSEAAAAETETVEYDLSDATSFVFSDLGIEAAEGAYSGYEVEGTALTILESGIYVVSGSCANGTISVKKNVTDVTLVLNGLELSASATAPITCGKGSEVDIVAAAGSVNELADDQYNNDETYTDETLYPDIENAVIKCKDGSNVTICGTGTINVTANGKNGVKGGYDLYEEDEDGNATDTLLSSASLTVRDVTLNITANVDDGLKSDKELNLLSGTITVSAVDDGIKCDYVMNVGAEGSEGPTVTVLSATEGMEAATLNVYSGTITVNASEDGINAANSDLTDYSYSYNQYGGDVYVNVSGGDGIDSNGSIELIGGTLEVYAPSEGDGDPLDSETGTHFAGTTVLAVGHAGMAQAYSAETPYVVFGGMTGGFQGAGGAQSELVSAGGEIQILDASGSVLYSAQAVRSASSVLFASPDLASGATYTLQSGGTSVASADATTAAAGGMAGPGQPPEGMQPGEMPTGMQPGEMPEGMQAGGMPDHIQPGQPPEGMRPGQPPEGMPEQGAGGRPGAMPPQHQQ